MTNTLVKQLADQPAVWLVRLQITNTGCTYSFSSTVESISSALISNFWLSTRFVSAEREQNVSPQSFTHLSHMKISKTKSKAPSCCGCTLTSNGMNLYTLLYILAWRIYNLNYSLKRTSVGLDRMFSQSMHLLSWTSCMRLKVQYIRIGQQGAAYHQSNCYLMPTVAVFS